MPAERGGATRTTAAVVREAWDRRWRDPRDRAAWSLAEPEVREVAAGLLPARGVRRVLDLGTGVGRHTLLLARAGFDVTACDVATVGLDRCRRAAAADGLFAAVHAASMTALPYADGAFDYVLAFNVVHFALPDAVRAAAAETRRVLAPGGIVQATMLSKRHVDRGLGREVAPDTFVPDAGPDAGQPHHYCDARTLCALFEGFEPLVLEDRLHATPGSWHWHLVAERRA